MRAKTIAVCLALCALLAGCDKKPAEAAKQPVYDLTLGSNAQFLHDNAAKPGVFKTQDGLQYRIIKSGTGNKPTRADDMVVVRYKGSLINGKVFDQTPAGGISRFPAGELIPGWVEALSMMKEGDQWELVIPAELGYGIDGAGNGAIPGSQTLVFDMTLLSVEPAE